MSGRILVAYDGSESAERAALKGCALATRFEAKVVLVFSARLDVPPYDTAMIGDPIGDLLRYGERILKDAQTRLASSGCRVEVEAVTGAPAETIARRAEADEVLYVVVGRGGRGAVSRFLMGSVANRLAHVCPKPLVIVA